MSVFKGHDDLSLNRYYYSFYSFSQDDPNTIKSFVYDQNQTLVSSKDISFNTRNIPDMLSFLENSQSNPYALGKSNDEFLNMDITFAGLYKKALTENQQQSLMTSINKTYKNVYYGTVNTFTIQVTQSADDSTVPVFIFNGDTSVENPMVSIGTVGLYIFDQSHPSNAGFPIAFRNMQSPFTPYTNVIVEGTPGTPNSYSLVSITDVSAPLLVEYYTTSTETNADSIFGELLNYLYQVKVETNIVGDPVFAIQSPGQSAYVLQPDLSFNIGDLAYFYVGDDSMADISLVFGPTVDDTANVVGSPYYVKKGDIILLDLTSDYDGGRLVYFEDTSAGMGYAPASSFHQTPTTDVPVSRQPYSNPSKEFKVLEYNVDIPTGINTTFALENTESILNFINEHYDGNTLNVPSETASAFKESQRLYYMHNDTIYYMFLMWFDAPWIEPDPPGDNYYSVISEKNTDLEANYPEAWGPRDYWLSDYGTGSGRTTGPGERHDYGTNVGNEQPYNLVDYASIGIPNGGNITVYYGDPLIPLSNVEYTITVVGGVFHVDGSPTPILSLINGLNYVFDQSHESNENNTLVIGTAPDISSSIVSSGLTIMGTPGQPGAYTHYVADGSTVYYFSYQTENMGEEPPTYTVKVVDHEITGEKVFSFKAPGTSTFINQPDLSFGAGDKYQFDVRDDTMADISLVFGTTVDDISTRNESVVSRYEGMILLDISSGYDGGRLVYFEETSAGMGYVPASSGGSISSSGSDAVINISFDTDGTNSGSSGSSGDMTITHDTIDTTNTKYGNGALYINSSASGYARSYIPTVFSSTPQNCCISLWMKVDTYIRTNHNIFNTKVDTYNLIFGFSSQTQFLLYMSGSDNGTINIPDTINPFDNTYHHYFFKIEGQIATVFVDGTNIGDRTFTTSITDKPMTEFKIGDAVSTNNPTTYYDDVRIFDKIVTIDEIISSTKNYIVDVSNSSLFRLDSGDGNGFVENPPVAFTSGTTYIFDQSHESNENNTLVIGTAFDDPASIVSSGLTIMGTPGQPGAYTKYVSDGTPVQYFSYQNQNMGRSVIYFSVQTNENGSTVWAVYDGNDNAWYNQPDLSFSAPNIYYFALSSLVTDGNYTLVFGTEVDNIDTKVEEGYVTRTSGQVVLDLTTYSSEPLVYFEETNSGMGYTSMPSSNNVLNTIFNGVPQPSFYWDFRTTTPENDGTNEYVTDIIGNSLKAVAYGTSFDNLDGPDLNSGKYLQIDPFTFGQPCSIEVYYNIHSFKSHGRIFDFGKGGPTENTASLDDIIILYDVGENITTFVSFDNSSISSKTGTSTVYNTWEHGILTVDSTSNLKLYRNKNEDLSYNTNTLDVIERTVNYIGRDHFVGGAQPLDGQVAFVRVWNGHILTSNEISNLFDTKDTVYVSSSVETYTVTVADDPSAFYLNNAKTPAITFNSGTTYIFDQSHESNANNTLVIGTAFDDPASIVSSGLTIMGTPGQPGAYTKYVSDGTPVQYFSYQTSNMGYNPTP